MTNFDKFFRIPNLLQLLNTLTKYPSIEVYHKLGQKGESIDELTNSFSFDNRTVYVTEKIDGTNSRVLMLTDDNGNVVDYIIGSRQDLLYARNDRRRDPTCGIVDTMIVPADSICLLCDGNLLPNHLYVLYGETYGGNLPEAKQYTSNKNVTDIRFFDMWHMPMDEVMEKLEMTDDKLSSWREHGGQPYVHVDELDEFCKMFMLTRVPYIKAIPGTDIPTSLQGVWDWMQEFAQTNVKMDDNARSNAEGVVVRYGDRSEIRKIRFPNYRKSQQKGLLK